MTDLRQASLSPSFSSSFSRSLSISSSSSQLSSPSTPSETSAFVPFLWETKPGISKGHAHKMTSEESKNPAILRTKSSESTGFTPAPDGKPCNLTKPLRPPPCLQQAPAAAAASSRIVASSLQCENRSQYHAKIKRGDDPFLLAMEACRKAGRKPSNPAKLTIIAKPRQKEELKSSLESQETEECRKITRSSSCESLSSYESLFSEHVSQDSLPFVPNPQDSMALPRNSELLRGFQLRRSTARSIRAQSVDLMMCGRRRKGMAGNRKKMADWFGCRSGHSFSVIQPELYIHRK